MSCGGEAVALARAAGWHSVKPYGEVSTLPGGAGFMWDYLSLAIAGVKRYNLSAAGELDSSEDEDEVEDEELPLFFLIK